MPYPQRERRSTIFRPYSYGYLSQLHISGYGTLLQDSRHEMLLKNTTAGDAYG